MIRFLVMLGALIAVGAVIRALLRPRSLSASGPDADSSDSPDALEPAYDGSEELIPLLSSPDPVAIEAYRGALHSAGIPAVVFDEAASRMFGRLPAIAMRIMVPVSRLAEAQGVIDDFEPGTFSDSDDA